MKTAVFLIYAILSGSLLALSWPEVGNQSYLIFISLFPLLTLEWEISLRKPKRLGLKVFLYAYLTFFVFNIWTTWWIKLASPGGMVLAEVFNSLFMATVFLAFHYTKRAVNDKVGYAALILYWLAFEYLHINWELSWIWLTLGNVFANDVKWIQWYEYTGTLGGSFWILVLNVIIYRAHHYLRHGYDSRRIQMVRYLLIFTLFFLPILLSYNSYSNYVEEENPIEVVVVQPNIDPYKDKFSGMHEHDQIDRLMQLSEDAITENTELVIGPETAFPLGYWEHDIEYAYGTEEVRKYLDKYPDVKYIVGLSTIRLYVKGEEMSPTARNLRDGSGNKYDYFNSVMQVEKDKELDIYRKSKLVLGVEKMPFTGKFSILEKLSIKLGGASGSLGTEKTPKNFQSTTRDGRNISAIPAICYESIYSEYLTEFIQLGANLLVVVTNDGWWGNTPGYHQHLAYARLRAIEMRRSVARSANTGISAFINQRGDIVQRTEWWVPDALNGVVNLNDEVTFYARHGDYIGRISSFFAVLLLVWAVVYRIKSKLI